MHILLTWPARNPRRALALAALICIVLTALASRVRVDFSFRPFYAPHPEREALTRESYETFGQVADGMVGLVLVGDVLTEDGARAIDLLSQRAARVPGVAAVTSATTLLLPNAAHGEDAWELSPLLNPSSVNRASTLARANAFKDAARLVLADDQRHTVVWAELAAPMENQAARKETVRRLEVLVDNWPMGTGFELHLVGYPVVERAYEQILWDGTIKAIILTAWVVALLLFVFLRRISLVVTALLGTAAALPAAMAALTILHAPLTMVSAPLPTVLLVIGVTDALHIIQRFRHNLRRGMTSADAAAAAMRGLSVALGFTALMTAIGFASLATTSMEAVRTLGAAAALGVFLVLITNVLAVPAWLSLFAGDDVERRGSMRSIRVGMAWVLRIVERFPLATGIASSSVFVALLVVAPTVETSQPFNKDVPQGHPIRASQGVLERGLAGFLGPEILVQRADGGSLLDDEALAAYRALEARVRSVTNVRLVVGLPDVMPPELTAAQLSLAIDLARSDEKMAHQLRHSIDDGDRRALMLVRTGDNGTAQSMRMLDELERIALTAPPPLKASLVGSYVQAQRGMGMLVDDVKASVSSGSLLVLLVLLYLLRAPFRALLALVANVVPVVGTLGAMALLGLPVKIGTVIALAAALGIACDDTVHLAHAMGRVGKTRGLAFAMRRAIVDCGPTVLLATMVLVLGFLSLELVELGVIVEMGRSAVIALVLAFLADLVWLPAMVLLADGLWRRVRGASPSTPIIAAKREHHA